MAKKFIPVVLLVTLCLAALYSCKKTTKSTGDATLNYFPLKIGKYVTYNVDSITYIGKPICQQLETRTQIKYAISDTFRDSKRRLSYIMDEYSRPDEGSQWLKVKVILLTPALIPQATTTPPPNTPQNDILYSQDGVQYEKLVFPITEGVSWKGNKFVDLNDADFVYLKNWNYTYQKVGQPFNNGLVNFANTVTVLENNEAVNYPAIDSALDAYRIYAKEVYAYNVGMIYKEWTYWTYKAFDDKCVNGYTVVMRAVDHN